jgi:hypothetical protein
MVVLEDGSLTRWDYGKEDSIQSSDTSFRGFPLWPPSCSLLAIFPIREPNHQDVKGCEGKKSNGECKGHPVLTKTSAGLDHGICPVGRRLEPGLASHNYGLPTTALGLTKRYPDAYETFVGSIVTMVLRS